MSTEAPNDIVVDSFSLTREVRDLVRALGRNKSAYVEHLIRADQGMPPRPEVAKRGRWTPGHGPKKPA